MREILFRAKAVDNSNNYSSGYAYRTKYKEGDWIYGLIIKPYNESLKLPTEMTSEYNNITGIKVDYTTIGQYIGITDKNGIKIFEGDIIKITDDDDVYIVEYNDEEAIFEATGQFNCICYNFSSDLFRSDVEVIGNIYDNPELMEEEDETD